jgi:hypothetical protein
VPGDGRVGFALELGAGRLAEDHRHGERLLFAGHELDCPEWDGEERWTNGLSLQTYEFMIVIEKSKFIKQGEGVGALDKAVKLTD